MHASRHSFIHSTSPKEVPHPRTWIPGMTVTWGFSKLWLSSCKLGTKYFPFHSRLRTPRMSNASDSSWAAVVLTGGEQGPDGCANDGVGGAESRVCGLSRCGYAGVPPDLGTPLGSSGEATAGRERHCRQWKQFSLI